MLSVKVYCTMLLQKFVSTGKTSANKELRKPNTAQSLATASTKTAQVVYKQQ